MGLATITEGNYRTEISAPSIKLMLTKGDVVTLSPAPGTVHILAGCAWITLAGEDIVLNAGEHINLMPGADHAVVSATARSKTPLILEMLGSRE